MTNCETKFYAKNPFDESKDKNLWIFHHDCLQTQFINDTRILMSEYILYHSDFFAHLYYSFTLTKKFRTDINK